MKQAQKFRMDHPDELNTEFFDKALPLLNYTIVVSHALSIPLTLLYFKYPKITRIFFIYEIVINMQEAFLPYTTRWPQS